MGRNANEARMLSRCQLQEALRDYKEACEKADGYDFKSDLDSILFDLGINPFEDGEGV